jgi:hypothetical protein
MPGTRLYTYYFDLEMVGSSNADSKFLQAKRPPITLDRQELVVALSTIQVEGTRRKIYGHQMFSLSLNFTVRGIARAEAEAKKKVIEETRKALKKAELREELIGSSVHSLRLGVLLIVIVSTIAVGSKKYNWQTGFPFLGILMILGIIVVFIIGVLFLISLIVTGRKLNHLLNQSEAIIARSVTV